MSGITSNGISAAVSLVAEFAILFRIEMCVEHAPGRLHDKQGNGCRRKGFVGERESVREYSQHWPKLGANLV